MKYDFSWIKEQQAFVAAKERENCNIYQTGVPAPASVDLIYPEIPNTDWTASFWVGSLFLLKTWLQTNEFDATIEKQMASFQERITKQIALNTHDIGFLYTLSAIAQYHLDHSPEAKQMAIDAADALMLRYYEKAGVIQAWGDLQDPKENGRIIIDCLMNLPLLYFAGNATGDERYIKAAYSHAKKTQQYIVRENNTTYHTYFFDCETGEALYGKTAQGYSDESCWSRGQAWGIYGFTLSYIHSGDDSFLKTACDVADYFISKLPADYVCYWDLEFVDGNEQECDSSAAAIAACGLLELAKQLPLANEKRSQYEDIAYYIVQSLQQNYTTKEIPASTGLLLHGVYDKNNQRGVDECMIWGDYFYIEALVRLSSAWFMYW